MKKSENVVEAIAEMLADPALNELEDPVKFEAFLKERGYRFSRAEWLAGVEAFRTREVSDDLLSEVSGGAGPGVNQANVGKWLNSLIDRIASHQFEETAY